MFKRWEIYLADLNPQNKTEPWKTRPVIIFQSDFLNFVNHPSLIVIPLTTNILEKNSLRFEISKRDLLKKKSQALLDQIRAISETRILWEKISQLSDNEIIEIEELMKIILWFEV